MTLKVSPTSYTGNTGLKVYIIKQIEREDKEKFESVYGKFFYVKKGLFKQVSIDLLNSPNAPKSYLVPLVYDSPIFRDVRLNLMSFKEKAVDAYYYKNGKPLPIERLYVNPLYSFLLSCPLIDFTKLSYVFQTEGIDRNTGMGDITNCSVNLTNIGGSSASFTVLNNDNYYNVNTKYDDLSNLYRDEYNKTFFSYPDVAIIRMEKRNPKSDSFLNSFRRTNYNNTLRKDPYAEGKNDIYKTVFTGYIRNVNTSVDYSQGRRSLDIRCQGPSIALTEKRMLMGPSVASKDLTASLMPLSILGYAQTNNDSNRENIHTSQVVKNLVTRVYTSITNIPEVVRDREKFAQVFNTIQSTEIVTDPNLGPLNKTLDATRNSYNQKIDKNIKKYSLESNKGQFIQVWKNSFISFDNALPCFQINGTNQPAFQRIVQSPTVFTSNFQTCFQFLQGLADRLGFNFYDDEFGTIRFELLDSSLYHLQKLDSPNRLTQVISVSRSENIDQLMNIQTVWGSWPFESQGTSESQGIGAVVRFEDLIKKYGERNNSPLNIPGITTVQACKNYAANIMYKHNSQIMGTYSANLICNPDVEVAKYAYVEEYNKLFFLGTVSHNWSSSSIPTTSVQGFYERDLMDLGDKIYPLYKQENQIQQKLELANTDEDIDEVLELKDMVNVKTWFDVHLSIVKSLLKRKFSYENPKLIDSLKVEDIWKYYFKGALWFPVFFCDIFNTSTFKTKDAL